MVKNIPCPKCDGHGIISEFTDHSVSVQTCTVCDGLGHIEAPMTNADRIRAMSDEELCDFLGQYKFCDICEEGCEACTYNGDCDKRLMDWLKQPAEERLSK